jgi:hypothetical protein
MNFIRSYRADDSYPINLDHVVSIAKDHAGSTTIIVFETSSGQTIRWRYFKNRTNRDLDYEELMLVIFPE